MKNIKCVVEYDGTEYYGSQKQKKHITIQEMLEAAVSRIVREDVKVVCSGRTDSGVHALGQVFSVKTMTSMTPREIVKGVNAVLPCDIVVKNARFVPFDFHARYSAKGKKYRYVVWNSKLRTSLKRHYSYHYRFPLDIEKMKKAARILTGKHDFRSFCSKSSHIENTVRTVTEITIRKKGNQVSFTVCGNGFLYRMVRNMVGVLLAVGSGKCTVKHVQSVLTSRDRRKAPEGVPAHGLTLLKVFY